MLVCRYKIVGVDTLMLLPGSRFSTVPTLPKEGDPIVVSLGDLCLSCLVWFRGFYKLLVNSFKLVYIQ